MVRRRIELLDTFPGQGEGQRFALKVEAYVQDVRREVMDPMNPMDCTSTGTSALSGVGSSS